MSKLLQQGQAIGILGGGQLGRMLAVAASRLGLRTHIFAPDANPVAGQVAAQVTAADYTDTAALTKFANSVDVITFEFENIPLDVFDILEMHCEVLPRRNALANSQDRLVEKDFLTGLGIKTAPYANVESHADLTEALARVGIPSLLKTRRFGYDGKGQVKVTHHDHAEDAWSKLGNAACLLEGRIDFTCEVSVIGTRSHTGQTAYYTPGQNVHKNGILHTTIVPASIPRAQLEGAVNIANKILHSLDYVGAMAVELFITPHSILVNEIAPRVHNSGHWTQNGCVIDQFEQHIRAVAGWPLGDAARHSDVVMTNLIGDEVWDVDMLCRDRRVGLHLYGKADAKPGRKMGHVNKITGPA